MDELECYLEVGSRIAFLEDKVEEELRVRGYQPLVEKSYRGAMIGLVSAERGVRITADDLDYTADEIADRLELEWLQEKLNA